MNQTPPPNVVVAQPAATSDNSSPSVAATVGCAVLGLMVLGPVGAVIGGTLGAAATMGGSSQRQPSLGVSRISLPREAICEQNGVTYFAVDVTHMTRGTWRVLRRYRNFDQLRYEVNVRYPFPGKHWFGCTGANLEARRRGLEAFTNYVALRFTHHGVPAHLNNIMHAFLEKGAVQLAAPPAAQGAYPALAAAPSAPGASAPLAPAMGQVLEVLPQNPTAPAAPAAPTAPAAPAGPVAPPAAPAAPAPPTQQQLLLSIPVPDGVKPGQLLGVRVPDGRELTVTVPPNCGQQLQVAFDPSAGSLTVVDNAAGPPATEGQGPSDDVFSIAVPMGVQPGQTLEVLVHGRRLLLTLPPGKGAGENILVRMDPAKGCLVAV